MAKVPSKTPRIDPLYMLILVSLLVFLAGIVLTNEQARLVFVHPFS